MREFCKRESRNLLNYLGDNILNALSKPSTTEIELNSNGKIWCKPLGRSRYDIGSLEADRVKAVIKTVAHTNGVLVNHENPMLIATMVLPLNETVSKFRFSAVMPPATASPVFCIRTRPKTRLSLDDYLSSGIFNDALYDFFKGAILQKKNIVIVGETGSGKTTLANALLAEKFRVFPEKRFIIIEHSDELEADDNDFAIKFMVGMTASYNQLIVQAMGMNPDFIIINEIKTPQEVIAMIEAFITHGGGIVTSHAKDAPSGLIRIRQLAGNRNAGMAEDAIDYIVHIAFFGDKIIITGVLDCKSEKLMEGLSSDGC